MLGQMPSQMPEDKPLDMQGEAQRGYPPQRPLDVKCVTYVKSL